MVTMGVKIQLTDRLDRPKSGYRVYVKWVGGGISNGTTNNSGIFDTGVSRGTIEWVEVYGERVLNRYNAGSGELISVTTSR